MVRMALAAMFCNSGSDLPLPPLPMSMGSVGEFACPVGVGMQIEARPGLDLILCNLTCLPGRNPGSEHARARHRQRQRPAAAVSIRAAGVESSSSHVLSAAAAAAAVCPDPTP
jgi:hypothetical protein